MKKIQGSLCVILSVISVAQANITVKVERGPDNGVPHTITLTDGSDPLGPYKAGDSFISFCVEYYEYFTPGFVYDVTLNDSAVQGGGGAVGGSDPLDLRSAWLYTEFLNGHLTEAYAVQKAIWHIEDEIYISPFFTTALAYVEQATAAVDSGWTDPGVWVMNLTYNYYGLHYAQDQLVFLPTVPAPGAVLLASLGIYMVSRRRWRIR